MYLPKDASKIREREAENARNNRLEIVKALNCGQISKRDLFKWGVFTATGLLVEKNGLSPFAKSAYAAVPTGTPRSPLFGSKKFTHPMTRLNLQKPIPLTPTPEGHASWGAAAPNEPVAKRLSWHNEFTTPPAGYTAAQFTNPISGRGPIEGRPPGEFFAHQRWSEFFPKVGYIMTLGCQKPYTTRFCDEMPY